MRIYEALDEKTKGMTNKREANASTQDHGDKQVTRTSNIEGPTNSKKKSAAMDGSMYEPSLIK